MSRIGAYAIRTPEVKTRADYEPLTLGKGKGGLDDVKWFRLQDIIDLNFYDDMLPIVTAAVQKLLDHAQASARPARV